jgi:hypothetical protein
VNVHAPRLHIDLKSTGGPSKSGLDRKLSWNFDCQPADCKKRRLTRSNFAIQSIGGLSLRASVLSDASKARGCGL